jgi:precorrin-4 methylase
MQMQEEIHELLLSFAEAGANVVRLKGGDPLVIYCSCLQTYYLASGGFLLHFQYLEHLRH